MSDFQPPPTWALPVLVDESSGKSLFNPIWLRWFLDLSRNLDSTGAIDIAANLAGGVAYQIPYQTAANTTSFYSKANYGVHIYGATGVPASIAGAAGVLQGSAAAIPAFTMTPVVTSVNGLVITTTTGTITLTNAKTFSVTNTLTLSGTDATVMTFPGASDTVVTLAAAQELDNKTLDASVGKGVWTASGTWTLPAITLGGTVSGGGNNLNNVVIGAVTPLAGSFTTVTATSILTTLGGATFHTTSSALTDGAGIGAGTLLNAPAAGNPTKWIGINDNGTTRYIPAW
tara:strand:+ start:1879 stop:2739 length:861 start_codon:yes stop_codon:yes gene_type:complete